MPSSDEPALEEVVVTARHVAEKAARVPLSIDVASGSLIGVAGVENLDSLASRFPGLAFESLWGGQGAAAVLRGLSQPSSAGDNVGLFVDDVYQAGRAAMDVDMLDLERVEVIRGPQNTLFGRSSFAGAIRYIPARPTESQIYRLRADLGSDALAGLQGTWSQRLGQSAWLARAVAGYRQSEGTFGSVAGETLGDARRRSLALTLAQDSGADPDRQLSLHVRLGDSLFSHPASTTLDAADFNCGARDSRSGYWTYYCGDIPVPEHNAISPGLPDSRVQSAQAALRLGWPIGDAVLSSLGSYYHATASSIRDFDGGTEGLWSGVCTVGVNCNASANVPVTRFAFPNVVSNLRQTVSDWSQELRLGGGETDKLRWMLGLAGSWTRTLESGSFGADRGDLLPDERLTSILATNPGVVGPQSLLNGALVPDSRAQQLLSTESVLRRYSLAPFGTLDVPIMPGLRTRLELRGEWEVLHVDPGYANFLSNDAPDPPSGKFWAVTPRFSLDFEPAERWYGFAAIARGARSGGVNTQPGLDADERSYGPEYNWTSELGLRYAGPTVLQGLQVTAYHVNWRNTQILGVATTPLITSFVTHNTAGIRGRGIEARLQLRAGRLLDAVMAWSLADTRFRAGSDDPGSRQICGLAVPPPASDFCAYGPPRMGNGTQQLVPYLDGNRTARAPRSSWNVALELPPRLAGGGWLFSAGATLASQADASERPVDGARYGSRQLLGARMTLRRNSWQLALWGSNLTDERYIRVASGRGGVFYPQQPRPIDLLYGEGRRAGLSLTFEAVAR